jgi:probable rRNA maturation factor
VSISLDIRTRAGGSVLAVDPRFPLTRRELTGVVEQILDALGLTGAHLSLTLLDDPAIALLNAKYLDCQGPTNILSFPEGHAEQGGLDSGRPVALGALFLSVDTLAREAFLYGQDPHRHLARLLAHGILHLCGHGHGPDMEALTDLAVDAVCPEAALPGD